jgi:NAD/NADP transhydrogenase beta subunit
MVTQRKAISFPLFYEPNCNMVFGDAQAVRGLVAAAA